MSRVNVPMGGSLEVFTSQEEYEPEQFNYANVRKAAYRGNMTITSYSYDIELVGRMEAEREGKCREAVVMVGGGIRWLLLIDKVDLDFNYS